MTLTSTPRHKAVDADSVASAVAGAELYGGTACRADGGVKNQRSVNGEVAFICKFANLEGLLGDKGLQAAEGAGIEEGVALPVYWDDADDGRANVVVVDHNSPSQMPGALGSQIGRVSPWTLQSFWHRTAYFIHTSPYRISMQGGIGMTSTPTPRRVVGCFDHHNIQPDFATTVRARPGRLSALSFHQRFPV
jgi:hypothetical protein